MIISAIITFLTGIVLWLLNLLPNADPTILSNVTTQFAAFKTWIGTANNVFPVDTLFTVLGLILVLESGLYLWKAFKWIGGIISGGIIKS